MKLISGILLILLGITMITMGSINGMLPPVLTGVGFLIITAVFILKEKGRVD